MTRGKKKDELDRLAEAGVAFADANARFKSAPDSKRAQQTLVRRWEALSAAFVAANDAMAAGTYSEDAEGAEQAQQPA